jgi:hypothetical protein
MTWPTSLLRKVTSHLKPLHRLTIIPLACAGCMSAAAAPQTLRPLTVADAIETHRFCEDRHAQSVFVSPDKTRYVTMVVRGDIQNDGIWMDILSGNLSSLAAAKPRVVAKLFTRGLPPAGPFLDQLAGPAALLVPGSNAPVWLSSTEIAFRWADELGHNQVFELDLLSEQLTQLTQEATDVVSFIFGTDRSFVYEVEAGYSPELSQRMMKSGFSVKSQDAVALVSGVVDGTSMLDLTMCHRLIAEHINNGYRTKPVADSKVKCDLSLLYWSGKLISPDGHLVILNSQVLHAPAEWSGYRGHFAEYLKNAEQDPRGMQATFINEFVVVDLMSGIRRRLWPVPASGNPWSTVAWSPNSKSVLVAPTMLPVSVSDIAALEGDAMAIVDVQTGRYERVPIDPQVAANIVSTDWVAEDRIALALHDGTTITYVKVKRQWRPATPGNTSGTGYDTSAEAQRVVVTVHQNMNEPPVLVGSDLRTRQNSVLYDPNPALLERFALGHVEIIHWTDAGGHRWAGRLYYPAHYRAGVRYPLVIQTHGYAGAHEFSIYGQGNPGGGVPLGPGWSVYLAQPLASRDIAVLQIGGPDDATLKGDSDFEGTKHRALTLADAAEHLVGTGLVDRAKVGIMGHSATGRVIEDALAFTDFPYAAAIAADHYQLNYSYSMTWGWDHDEGMPAPFGKDLAIWMNDSPAFNVERIQTPLQLEVTSGGGNSAMLSSWEMFSRLRYLNKPVEYYVLPDIEHGSHLIQNPRQLLALQGRALDWWLFWLLSVEDPADDKAPQYQEWRALRDKHIADLARPKPPMTVWKSTPEITQPRAE